MASNKKDDDNHKLQQVVNLLKLALSLEDNEILTSTVESITEIIEEIIK